MCFALLMIAYVWKIKRNGETIKNNGISSLEFSSNSFYQKYNIKFFKLHISFMDALYIAVFKFNKRGIII